MIATPEQGLTAAIEAVVARRHIPHATYRFQFNKDFPFSRATELVPYLHALGITDCYASPILLAAPGSMHGYNICDHTRLNPELGTPEDFDALVAALHTHDMGLILDMVPNHMGINHEANHWWMDVLENGPHSQYAGYFDIDWHPIKAEIQNKVLLPILDDQYGRALEAGKMRLALDKGAFSLYVGSLRLPIAPYTYADILLDVVPRLISRTSDEDEAVQDIQSIITALIHLATLNDPGSSSQVGDSVSAERYREQEVAKRRIAQIYEQSPEAREAIDETLAAFNGTADDPASFDKLHVLIAQQWYRPAFWRVAAEEINYRRFFDVNELAAIQIERDEVFEATHALIFTLLAEGKINGLRIDHPDGLWEPAKYFQQLQTRYLTDQLMRDIASQQTDPPTDEDLVRIREEVATAAGAWVVNRMTTRSDEPVAWPLYIVIEKILSDKEPMPRDWPVYGTTGYDFLNNVNDILILSESEKAFSRIYGNFIDSHESFATMIREKKRLTMTNALVSEINSLAHRLERVTENNRRYRDFTLNSLTYGLRLVVTALQVYRTYITRDPQSVSSRDSRYIHEAIAEAKQQNQRVSDELFDFLEETLLLRNLHEFKEDDRQAVTDFVMKFQQVTGPVTAKSIEDTAFYTYNRLVSLNEVGGNPEIFGVLTDIFHEQNEQRAQDWPHAMLTTSTHDTKRSEDVRARISALSEIPDDWEQALHRWSTLNARLRTGNGGEDMPDHNDEYLLYQTLLGTWPGTMDDGQRETYRVRIVEYMKKAVNEAKVHTSWLNYNAAYVDALSAFISGLLDPLQSAEFLQDFSVLAERIARAGYWNSMTTTVLKLTAPGVTDIYQGNELLDFSLVDPDNRRPIDFAVRQRMLEQMPASQPEDLLAAVREISNNDEQGVLKLYITQTLLRYRSEHRQLFATGRYKRLDIRDDHWLHACAFMRQAAGESFIVVTGLHPLVVGGDHAPVGERWQGTWVRLPGDLAEQRFRDLLTGQIITVTDQHALPVLFLRDVLAHLPVAVLIPEPVTR